MLAWLCSGCGKERPADSLFFGLELPFQNGRMLFCKLACLRLKVNELMVDIPDGT